MQALPICSLYLLPWGRKLPSTDASFLLFRTRSSGALKSYLRVTTAAFADSSRRTSIRDYSEDGDDGSEEEASDDGESSGRFTARGRQTEEEKDYDRDPEIADIMGSFMEDPQKAQSRVEERIRSKRNKILQAKTGSSTPMKVTLKKFKFSNSYIWFEFYHPPLTKDIELICDAIRSWHIIGRLGGCNAMNMQLSQLELDKRPTYDAIQGANVTPTTFYNIGDLEIQENLARIWVDIGTSEPLLLDVLVNALTNISSEYASNTFLHIK
ncbi:unnamed protein product [Victoria cruziana]